MGCLGIRNDEPKICQVWEFKAIHGFESIRDAKLSCSSGTPKKSKIFSGWIYLSKHERINSNKSRSAKELWLLEGKNTVSRWISKMCHWEKPTWNLGTSFFSKYPPVNYQFRNRKMHPPFLVLSHPKWWDFPGQNFSNWEKLSALKNPHNMKKAPFFQVKKNRGKNAMVGIWYFTNNNKNNMESWSFEKPTQSKNKSHPPQQNFFRTFFHTNSLWVCGRGDPWKTAHLASVWFLDFCFPYLRFGDGYFSRWFTTSCWVFPHWATSKQPQIHPLCRRPSVPTRSAMKAANPASTSWHHEIIKGRWFGRQRFSKEKCSKIFFLLQYNSEFFLKKFWI